MKSVKKYKLYHGTSTGPNDLWLEEFIVTGAVSSKEPLHGGIGGFYMASDKNFARNYTGAHAPERGMLIEIETELDGKNWQIDGNKGGMAPLTQLILAMKDIVLAAPENILPFLSIKFRDPQGSEISLEVVSIQELKTRTKVAYMFSDQEGLHKGSFAFERLKDYVEYNNPKHAWMRDIIIQNLCAYLEKNHPERFAEENLKFLTKICEKDKAILRYTGKAPLRVNHIWLRPPQPAMGAWDPRPEEWEMVYDRHAKKAKPAVRKAPAPAKTPRP